MERSDIPKHIAFVMDGNGRWAKERGLSRSEGHLAGISHISQVIDFCFKKGIQYITVYVWSTENWSRPDDEVTNLMNAIVRFGPDLAKKLHKDGCRILHCGSRENLSTHVLEVIDFATQLTKNDGPKILNLAFNYGGQKEIVDAAKRICYQNLPPEQITETTIAANLYSPELSGIDLLIRTGGEKRLSNFMLWESAYSTLYVTNTYWPALQDEEINKAIAHYADSLHRPLPY
jgi:undecaprenyl diphosphate synthase